MSDKNEYKNGCFSPNWLEVDLRDTAGYNEQKEVYRENKLRKDLNTLLKELEEIKQNIVNAAEKQRRLANLMGFYNSDFAK